MEGSPEDDQGLGPVSEAARDNEQPKMNGARRPTMDEAIDKHIQEHLNVFCAGIFGTVRGVPPEKIIAALARNMGRQIGLFYRQGLLIPLMQKRRDCIDAFTKSIDEVKMIQVDPADAQKLATPPGMMRKAAGRQ